MTTWPYKRLDEFCTVISGATPKTGVSSYWDGDIKWVTPADLSALKGKYIDDTPRKITQEGLRSCSATILPTGSVLLSSRAPIGHVAVTAAPMATNQGFKSLIPNSDLADPSYLYHWLRVNKEYLESLGTGATFKEVSKAVVSRIRIPLPPVEEQRRIASALDLMSELHVKRRQAISLLDELVQSIFLQLFGEPNRNPYNFPRKEVKEIISYGDRINYGVIQPGDEQEGGIPLIRVGDLVGGQVRHGMLKRIDPSIERDYRRSRIRGNEILVGCVGSIGTVSLASEHEIGFNIARAVSRIPIDSYEMRRYVAEYLRTPHVQGYFRSQLRTVAQPTLNIKQLADTVILIPPVNLIEIFAGRVRIVDELRSSSLAQLSEMGNLAALLQDRAFRGEL